MNDQEQEITFEELGATDLPPLPTYDERGWLVALPALLALLLAWNVAWRRSSRGGPKARAA